jgi:hypothetical protein
VTEAVYRGQVIWHRWLVEVCVVGVHRKCVWSGGKRRTRNQHITWHSTAREVEQKELAEGGLVFSFVPVLSPLVSMGGTQRTGQKIEARRWQQVNGRGVANQHTMESSEERRRISSHKSVLGVSWPY